MPRMQEKPSNINRLIQIISAIALLYGVSQAISYAWVCDDAFISFRYAKNLVGGHGLVYNVGEYVEGYSNFLWTILVALGMLVKIDPVISSKLMGLASFCASILILIAISRHIAQSRTDSKSLTLALLPLSAICFAFNRDAQVYATSGLETAFYTALILLGFYFLLTGEKKSNYFLGGLALVACATTRPDGLAFYFSAIPFLLIANSCEKKRVIWYLLPLAVVFAPYWLIKYAYYGYPMPNSYYAKSAALSDFPQGLTFLWMYLKTYYGFILIPAFMSIISVNLIKGKFDRQFIHEAPARSALLALILFTPYLFSVVKVGGDFMFARLLIPVTPFFYIFIESALTSCISRISIRYAIGAVLALSIIFRWNQIDGLEKINKITDEVNYYPAFRLQKEKADGEFIRPYLEECGANVAFMGMRCMLVYYAQPKLAIEAQAGLTDEYVAHLPLRRRGRPGHEKKAPIEYLRERRTHFWFKSFYSFTGPQEKLRRLKIGDFETYVLIYENEVMDKLRVKSEVSFTHFPTYLDQYFRAIKDVPLERLKRDYELFKNYYFDYNDDPERAKRFTEILEAT